jgi:hypothetical protein
MEMAGATDHLCRPGDGLAALSTVAQAALDNNETLRRRLGDHVEQMRRRIMGEAARVSGIIRGS